MKIFTMFWSEKMTEFIKNLIGNDIWATVIMSIVPLIELKGGIIFARSAGMGFLQAFGLAYVGSTIVFIPIYFLLKPILNLLKKVKWFSGFANKVEGFIVEKADNAMQKQLEKKGKKTISEKLIKQLVVLIFVAIPLPMTGVWMGTAVAVFLGLKFKDVIIPILTGNLIAGLLISLLAELFLFIGDIAILDYVLWALFGLAIVLFVVTLVKVLRTKSVKQEDKKED